MKKLLSIILGIIIASNCSFAMEESVEDMISRIVGKSNPSLQTRIETGLEMGTIEESDVEQIITDFKANAEDEGEVGSSPKSNKNDTKTVISISRVADCFDTLFDMTENKKFAMVGKNYRQYFKDNGKPLTQSDDGEQIDNSDVPFASTDIPTIMMDYSKCLFSVAKIKMKMRKLPNQKSQESSTSSQASDEGQEDTHEANSSNDEDQSEETGALAVVTGEVDDSDVELDSDVVGSSNVSESSASELPEKVKKEVVDLYKKKDSEMKESVSFKIKSSQYTKGLKVASGEFENLPESSVEYPEEMKDIVKSVKKEAKDKLSLLELGVDSARDFLATMWSFSVKYLDSEGETEEE